MADCQWCFHVAASYHLWLRDYRPMHAANIEGTKKLIETAIEVGCLRIVHTSTVGCIGLPQKVGDAFLPSDERAMPSKSDLSNHYKRSKWEAEKVASAFAEAGHPIVIVNPSTPIGARDVKPTPTGKVIVDFLNRRLFGYVETGLNWVHVQDVAAGHILAAEKGRLGERYILGNAMGNMSMLDALQILSETSGVPVPRFKVPFGVAWMAAFLNEAFSSATHIAPKVPMAGVRMAKHKMWFNPNKAIVELGLPQSSVRSAFEDAVKWFRTNGYVKN